MKRFFKDIFCKRGFALITVLLLSTLLLLLMISLVSLSSQSLFGSARSVERAYVVPVAETAVNEAIIILRGDLTWGLSNENLFYIGGGQELETAGLDPSVLTGSSNNEFELEGKNCFYISFDPDDPAFSGTKYYSVNYLNPSNPPPVNKNWKGLDVPPGTASIVVTAAVGNKVQHIEAILRKTIEGNLSNGSRGKVIIDTKNFKMEEKNGKPSFHSNFIDAVDRAIDIFDSGGGSTALDIKDDGSISANGEIYINSSFEDAPPVYDSGAGEKVVPNLDINGIITGITFNPDEIPSGTYEVGAGNHLIYTDDITGISTDLGNGAFDIVTGFHYSNGDFEISKNLQVEQDDAGVDGTGNLTIINSKKFKFKTPSGADKGIAPGYILYAPGNETRNFLSPGAPYEQGNIKIVSFPSCKILEGKGNIYVKGGLDMSGKTIDAGLTSEEVAIFSNGDIEILTKDDSLFKGLIYTYGDLKCKLNTPSKNFKLEGAIIVAGKDPVSDPAGAVYDPGEINMDADNVEIKFDDKVLGALDYSGTGSLRLEIVSWHEI